MSGTRAEKQKGEEKIHGDQLENAVASAGEHVTGRPETGERESGQHEAGERGQSNSAIPAAEDGGHPRSPAAHLGGHIHDHTKPVGDMRQYEAEREPPKEVSRTGKQSRR